VPCLFNLSEFIDCGDYSDVNKFKFARVSTSAFVSTKCKNKSSSPSEVDDDDDDDDKVPAVKPNMQFQLAHHITSNNSPLWRQAALYQKLNWPRLNQLSQLTRCPPSEVVEEDGLTEFLDRHRPTTNCRPRPASERHAATSTTSASSAIEASKLELTGSSDCMADDVDYTWIPHHTVPPSGRFPSSVDGFFNDDIIGSFLHTWVRLIICRVQSHAMA